MPMITISGKYASADVYVAGFDTLDSASYGQIVQLLSVPCMKGSKIAIMPDVHAGIGACVGLPTVNKNFHKIHQNLTKFTSTIL